MDKRTAKKFVSSFVSHGGHNGSATLSAAFKIYNEYLYPTVTANAAGKLMADKFSHSDKYINNMVIGPAASLSYRAVYAVDGVGKWATTNCKVIFNQ